jgi:ADP-heptose:LPS heptosyltransferase
MNKKNKKQSFVILTLAHIGDFIWATSAISLVKKTNSSSKLALIIFDSVYSLADKSLRADKIILVNSKYYNHKNKFIKNVYKIFCCLKYFFILRKYETIIFFEQYKIWSLFAKYIYKIKNIVGPNLTWYGYNVPDINSKYYTHIINMPINSNKTHMMIRYQIMIRSFLNTCNLSVPILPDTTYLKDKISELLGNKKKYSIALCLEGNNVLKSWEIENWTTLIKLLTDVYKDISFFILGTGDSQKLIVQDIVNSLKNIDIRNFVNKTSLLEVKELLKYVDLLLTVDTGIAHIAGVLNLPTIVLYGPTLPDQCRPVNCRAEQICLYEKCSPCNYNLNNNCSNNFCLINITPEMVFATADIMLSKYCKNN